MQNTKARKPGPTHRSTVSSSGPHNWKKVQVSKGWPQRWSKGWRTCTVGEIPMEFGLSTLEKIMFWRDLKVLQYLKGSKKEDRGFLFTWRRKCNTYKLNLESFYSDRRFFFFFHWQQPSTLITSARTWQNASFQDVIGQGAKSQSH